MAFKVTLLFFSIVLLVACQPEPQSKIFHAFGTEVVVEFEEVSPNQAPRLFESIDHQLKNMHERWHAWQQSELSTIREACETGQAAELSPDVIYLLKQGQLLEKTSLGYFNPAIGELINAWGFLSHTSSESRQAPSEAEIKKLLSYHPSLSDLVITGRTLTCSNPHVRIDFGAYAKGYAVGLIVDYLISEGIQNALVNAGGDLMILQAPGRKPRKIGITSPDSRNTDKVLFIDRNISIFTSGTYARFFEDTEGKKRYHHLINPHTGLPSDYFSSVTVLHPNPLIADAAATALLASDKNSWSAVAKSMGLNSYLLITGEGEIIESLPKEVL